MCVRVCERLCLTDYVQMQMAAAVDDDDDDGDGDGNDGDEAIRLISLSNGGRRTSSHTALLFCPL